MYNFLDGPYSLGSWVRGGTVFPKGIRSAGPKIGPDRIPYDTGVDESRTVQQPVHSRVQDTELSDNKLVHDVLLVDPHTRDLPPYDRRRKRHTSGAAVGAPVSRGRLGLAHRRDLRHAGHGRARIRPRGLGQLVLHRRDRGQHCTYRNDHGGREVPRNHYLRGGAGTVCLY